MEIKNPKRLLRASLVCKQRVDYLNSDSNQA